MSKTHWKKFNNPEFLGAYAIEPGEDLIATIQSASQEKFTGQGGKKDEGLVVHFAEKEIKPLICNATNAKAITKVAGTPFIEEWAGVRIAMYATEVSAFGDTVEALRVRTYAPKAAELFCEECGAEIKAANSKSPKWIAQYTKNNYGKQLCSECAKKIREAQADETDEE